jgi:branched-subunit amino acid transport protein
MTAWLVVLAVGAGSYALRGAFVVALAGRPTPEWVTRVSRFVLPAAFAALAVGALHSVPAVIAVVVAGVVASRTHSSGIALAAGLPALWIVQTIVR